MSQIDRSCQKIELVEFPSASRVKFHILPRYQYRADGEPVVYNDNVLLYNSKFNVYLNVSEGEEYKID